MKKYFIISILFLMAAGAIAQTVTDNPYGAQYPSQLRRAAKSTPVALQLRTWCGDDTVGSAGPTVVVDTTTQRTIIWRAPFDCKVDSFYVSCGLADSVVAADSFRFNVVGNTSGTNGDTIICDSLNGVQALYTPISLHGGPDSTKTVLTASKYLRIWYDPAGSATTTKTTFSINFVVTPADRAK